MNCCDAISDNMPAYRNLYHYLEGTFDRCEYHTLARQVMRKSTTWQTLGPNVYLMRVNVANVLDEGLRIEEKRVSAELEGKISQRRRGLVCVENKHCNQLAQSQSVPDWPFLAPLYRWLGLEDTVRFNTNYNVCI
jgi:hypothetical protein